MSDQTELANRIVEAGGGSDRRTMVAQHKLLLRGIVGRLEEEFGDLFTRDTLGHYVEDSYSELSSNARVLTHIPSFVDRFSRQRLRSVAKNQGLIKDHRAEVLFVCERNDAVSQIASALFDAAAGGRGQASSAGTAPAPDVLDEAIYVMHEIGIDLLGEFPKPLTKEVEQAADVIVTLDAHDDIEVIEDKQYFAWRLPDHRNDGVDGYRELRDDLSRRVDELIDLILPPAPPHTRVALDEAIAVIDAGVERMGALVVSLGERLGRALQAVDATERHAILDADDEIDDLEKEILRAVLETIARHQPVASDLRGILAVHDIAIHLERIADGFVDVAGIADGNPLAIGTSAPASVTQMAELATTMTRDSLMGLTARDVELALGVAAANRDLGVLADGLFEDLARSGESSSDNRHVIDVARASRVLKRCGEHAVDIAEQTVFLATGELHELGRENAAARD